MSGELRWHGWQIELKQKVGDVSLREKKNQILFIFEILSNPIKSAPAQKLVEIRGQSKEASSKLGRC